MKAVFKALVFFSCWLFSGNSSAQELVILPYKVIANKMIVEVNLNGKLTPMIFDTGGRNSISSKLKKELQTAVISSRALTDANGNKFQSEIVKLDKVEVGNGKAVFNDFPFYVFDNELFACLGAEGFIGSNLFHNNSIQIDDQKKEISIIAGGMPGMSADRRAIPFTDDAEGMPVISVNMGKYDEAKVLFDTGSDGFLTLMRSEYIRLKQQDVFHVSKEGEGGGSIGASGRGGIGKQILLEIPELAIGQISFMNIRASVSTPPKTLFGYQSLKYGKVTIDYVNKQFRFEPFKPGKIEVESKKVWDIAMSVEGNQLVVATVWDKLIGQAEVGDVVTHINGIAVKPMGFCESITAGLPVLKENNQVILTVKTKQGIKSITINKS